MLNKEKMDRLNELAKKAKNETLSKDEMKEQKMLREEYIKSFRQHFRQRLDNIVFVDEQGNEIKREKGKPIQ